MKFGLMTEQQGIIQVNMESMFWMVYVQTDGMFHQNWKMVVIY